MVQKEESGDAQLLSICSGPGAGLGTLHTLSYSILTIVQWAWQSPFYKQGDYGLGGGAKWLTELAGKEWGPRFVTFPKFILS